MNNLGGIYLMQGHYDKAEPLLLKSFEISKRLLGEEHEDTLTYMNNLGSLYRDQARYDEAELLLLKTLDIRKRLLNEEHLNTLKSMNSLGLLYEEQGRYDQAEPLLFKSLELSRQVLGEENPDTLKSMRDLAYVYYLQKRYGEAIGLLTKVSEIEQRVSGKEHIDTLKTDDNVATANGGQQIHKQVSDNTEELNLPEDTTTRLLATELRIQGNTLFTKSELLDHIPEIFNASDRPLSEAPTHYLYDLRAIRDLVARPGLVQQVSVRAIQGLTQYILSIYKKNDYIGIYVHVPKEAIIDGPRLVNKILQINIIEAPVSEIRFKFFDAKKNEVEENYSLRLAIEEWTPIELGKVGNRKAVDQFVNLLNLIPEIQVDMRLSREGQIRTH